MPGDRETLADSRFRCNDRERACFEAGIKMATIYHQFVGTPFCERNVGDLEKTIAECIKVQPYVRDAEVSIRRGCGDKEDQYSYTSLTGDMIDATVVVELGGASVKAVMRYDAELGYPLLYIEDIQ